MKVAKFGGTSLASAEQVEKICAIITSDPKRTLVVVSAPGKRDRKTVWPMVTSGKVVHLRRATKFSSPEYDSMLKQVLLMESIQQGRHRHVQHGIQFTMFLVVIDMGIPAPEGYFHATDSDFHQSCRCQATTTKGCIAKLLPNRLGNPANFKCLQLAR